MSLPCVILAGGKGTRLSEETAAIPKPMLDVGGKPMLQHIMDIYLAQGVHEFIIPVGYKKEQIYGYFHSLNPLDISTHYDVQGATKFSYNHMDVTVVDTGLETLTGGRLHRLNPLIKDRAFHFTYGDGVGNVKIKNLQDNLMSQFDTYACITTVHPDGRFGRAVLGSGDRVTAFGEKVETETEWINGGFAVLTPPVLDAIPVHGGDRCNLEKDLYPLMAELGLMSTVRHTGYWKCVDTLRDLEELRHTYETEGALWLRL